MGRTKMNSANNETKNGIGTSSSNVDLATIRGDFDGLQKQVNSLPDGKTKKNLMNSIEKVYFKTASWFQGIAEAPAFEA